MSVNTFENTNLDFDISIIKMAREQNKADGYVRDVIESVTPLDAAAILNLDLRESSLAMGFTGTITINNKFKVLDNLDITTNSPNDIYIAIKITDVDLESIGDIPEEDKCITLIGYINNTSSGAINMIDSIIVFEFEEAFVAALKKMRAMAFAEDETATYDVVSLANEFNNRFYKLKDSGTVTTLDTYTPNVLHNIYSAFDYSRGGPSVYEAMQRMLKESAIGPERKVAYFRFVNRVLDNTQQDSNVVRQLQYAPYLTDRHVQFIHAVANNIGFVKGFKAGETTSDFSDVYLEKFTLGPLSNPQNDDANTSLYNKIETYNITRANTGQLKETIWGNYRVNKVRATGTDLSKITSETRSFSEIQLNFISSNLYELDVSFNLPLLEPRELRDFYVYSNSHATPEEEERSIEQLENRIVNIVHKSFLTITETINFKVKGNVIRRPNVFIWIENGQTEEGYKKLWYVNSVNHVFASGKYTTEIVASKLFGNTTYDAILQNEILGAPINQIYDRVNPSEESQRFA